VCFFREQWLVTPLSIHIAISLYNYASLTVTTIKFHHNIYKKLESSFNCALIPGQINENFKINNQNVSFIAWSFFLVSSHDFFNEKCIWLKCCVICFWCAWGEKWQKFMKNHLILDIRRSWFLWAFFCSTIFWYNIFYLQAWSSIMFLKYLPSIETVVKMW